MGPHRTRRQFVPASFVFVGRWCPGCMFSPGFSILCPESLVQTLGDAAVLTEPRDALRFSDRPIRRLVANEPSVFEAAEDGRNRVLRDASFVRDFGGFERFIVVREEKLEDPFR